MNPSQQFTLRAKIRFRNSESKLEQEAMDSQDWEPPTEAEMKLLQARRERSDKISKLMSSYLLKGYKMLGTVCSVCDTILLQDRQGNNYCVACSELDSDADKDNPVTSQSAAMSMAKEIELATGGTATTQPDSRVLGGAAASATPAAKSTAPALTPRTLPSQTGHMDYCGDGTQVLSMSSIDVQCWPSDSSSGRRDQGAVKPQSDLSIKLEGMTSGLDSDSGLASISGENLISPPSQHSRHQANAQQQTSRSSLSSSPSQMSEVCISRLSEKIVWASKELKDTPSVEYSIQLCNLIKTAAEAVTAVRAARI